MSANDNGQPGRDLPSDPLTPSLTPQVEGLVLEVGVPQMTEDDALALAREVVGTTLPGTWDVQTLGEGSRDFEAKPSQATGPVSISTAWDLVAKLKTHRDVVSAEPAFVLPGHDVDEDRIGDYLTSAESTTAKSGPGPEEHLPCAETDFDWVIRFCAIDDAWGLDPAPGGSSFGDGIIVGHPDTGYTRHPQIWSADSTLNRLLINDGHDFVDEDHDPEDPLDEGIAKNPSHGTSTASVIMSGQDTAPLEGVTGVAPMARLVPLRVARSVIRLSFANLARAIRHAADNGCHLISISLGGPLKSRFLQRAVQYAIDRGVIVLAAAGNAWPWVVWPARFDEVIGVGACNCERKRWRKSARGPDVDISAPGESVWRAQTKEGVPRAYLNGMGSGTSYAVATAAGACALWLGHHGRQALIDRYGEPNLAAVFKETLINHGVKPPPGWNTNKDGAGILDVKKLLEADLPATPPASGMKAIHASFGARESDAMEEILSYFPESDAAQVRLTVLNLIRSDDRELGIVLGEQGDELIFHIATNPAFRGLIAQMAGVTIPKSITTKQLMTGEPRFREQASESLKERMGL